MRNGRPRRPVERAIEQAEASACPHTILAGRLGQSACRVCGAQLEDGRLGYDACRWIGGAQAAGESGLDRVREAQQDQQVLRPGAMARPGRTEASPLAGWREAAHTGGL